MAIKKFKDYKVDTKLPEQEETIKTKRIENDSMSDSITDYSDKKEPIIKLEDGEYEIVGINDITVEKPDIKEAIIINADLGGKSVKRGDTLWITAMVTKKNVNWNSMAVLKVRISDMFQGLSILNTIRD